MSVIAPNDLITRTYLTEPDANTGERFRAKIVKKIVSLEKGLEEHPERVEFLVTYEGNDRLDEIVAYNLGHLVIATVTLRFPLFVPALHDSTAEKTKICVCSSCPDSETLEPGFLEVPSPAAVKVEALPVEPVLPRSPAPMAQECLTAVEVVPALSTAPLVLLSVAPLKVPRETAWVQLRMRLVLCLVSEPPSFWLV